MSTLIPRVKKLIDDTEKFHRKVDPLIDARVLALSKGQEVPDDPLTVMVKENMTRKQMYVSFLPTHPPTHPSLSFSISSLDRLFHPPTHPLTQYVRPPRDHGRRRPRHHLLLHLLHPLPPTQPKPTHLLFLLVC